jgi:hypothetical protein
MKTSILTSLLPLLSHSHPWHRNNLPTLIWEKIGAGSLYADEYLL